MLNQSKGQPMTLLSVVQMNSQNDIDANFVVIESLIRQSQADGASFIVFPENFVCFAAGKQRETAERFEEIQKRLENLADQHQMWIVAGTLPCPFRPDGSIIEDGTCPHTILELAVAKICICRKTIFASTGCPVSNKRLPKISNAIDCRISPANKAVSSPNAT